MFTFGYSVANEIIRAVFEDEFRMILNINYEYRFKLSYNTIKNIKVNKLIFSHTGIKDIKK